MIMIVVMTSMISAYSSKAPSVCHTNLSHDLLVMIHDENHSSSVDDNHSSSDNDDENMKIILLVVTMVKIILLVVMMMKIILLVVMMMKIILLVVMMMKIKNRKRVSSTLLSFIPSWLAISCTQMRYVT